MLVMKFKEYDTNKFMAINAPVELDIIVTKDEVAPYVLKNVFDSYAFKTWDEAVEFAEFKYGVNMEMEA